MAFQWHFNPFTSTLDKVSIESETDPLSLHLDQSGTPQTVINGVPLFNLGIKAPKLYPDTDSTTGIQLTKADGTTYIVNIDTTNSRVGIGTNAPSQKLHVYNSGTGDTANVRQRIENNGGAQFDLIGYGATNTSNPHLASRALMFGQNCDLIFGANTNKALYFYTGGSAAENLRMTIASAGNVTIANDLIVSGGGLSLDDSAAGVITFRDATPTNKGKIQLLNAANAIQIYAGGTAAANLIATMTSTGHQIGGGQAADYTLSFNTDTNDGFITWSRVADYFTFQDDLFIPSTESIYFRDTAISINSLDDGHLDLTADVSVDLLIGSNEQINLSDGKLAPTADSDIDLGDGTHYFKDAFIDSITMTGIISAGISDLYVKHAVYSDSTTQSITSTTVPWAITFDTTETAAGVTLGRTGTVTITNATPAVISWASHGLYVDSPVVFTTTDTLPAGLTPGTTYYIISAGFGANSFQVSATPQGAAINTSSDGAGTHTATNTSVMAVDVAGCYGFIFSTLCVSSSAGTTFDIWFRKNGTNIDRSNTRTEVANANNVIVSVADIVENLAAGDKIEMFWVSDSTNGQLLAIATQTNPTRPATPSTILTVKKISKC